MREVVYGKERDTHNFMLTPFHRSGAQRSAVTTSDHRFPALLPDISFSKLQVHSVTSPIPGDIDPIYLHHLCPFTLLCHLMLPVMIGATRKLRNRRPIGCCRSSTQRSQADMPYSLSEIEQCLNGKRVSPVLLAGASCHSDRARAGISGCHGQHRISPWVGGQIPITESVCNRAGYAAGSVSFFNPVTQRIMPSI
jgi:hypothetical protein